MNAEQIRWWMEVFRMSVYVHLVVIAAGAAVIGAAMMLGKGQQHQALLFLFGLALFALGAVLSLLSGIAYDKLYIKLPSAESAERKEKDKEKKHAAKSKTH